MFLSESIWIKEKISALELPPGSAVLDIGSSTLEFRRDHQPYIDANVFDPLKKRGLAVTRADKKSGKGIDLVIDIERPHGIKKKFDLVICSNVLEHLTDTASAAENIIDLVRDGGYLLVSVPFLCAYHPDPIDTMFRPSNIELEKSVPRQKVLESAIISSRTADLSEEKVSVVIWQKTAAQIKSCRRRIISQGPLIFALNVKNKARKIADQAGASIKSDAAMAIRNNATLKKILLHLRKSANRLERHRDSKKAHWILLIFLKDRAFSLLGMGGILNDGGVVIE